jgi:hypothetical protein
MFIGKGNAGNIFFRCSRKKRFLQPRKWLFLVFRRRCRENDWNRFARSATVFSVIVSYCDYMPSNIECVQFRLRLLLQQQKIAYIYAIRQSQRDS